MTTEKERLDWANYELEKWRIYKTLDSKNRNESVFLTADETRVASAIMTNAAQNLPDNLFALARQAILQGFYENLPKGVER